MFHSALSSYEFIVVERSKHEPFRLKESIIITR